MNGSLSILVIRALHTALSRDGESGDELLRALDIPRELLERGDARLPAAVVFRAIERAGALSGDPCFSLRAASAIPLGTIDVLDFAMRSSATMREALERAVRYFALIDDCSELRLDESDGVARLSVSRRITTSPRVATELLFAVLLSRGRLLTGAPWPLREVHFLAGPPDDAAPHRRFFDAPVVFASVRNELVFDAAWLDTRCAEVDAELSAFFERHAEALLAQVHQRTELLDRVRAAIAEPAAGADPSLEITARRISLSPRTLQRRLEAGGTSYKALVEEVRRARALALLADPRVGIAEIGATVGYGDARAFYRAFRRWTGSTPAKVRCEMVQRA